MSCVTQEEDLVAPPSGSMKQADQSAFINLTVKGPDGDEVFFSIKPSTKLWNLMNAYCDRQLLDFDSIAFLFDGRRLHDGKQTPAELQMEDGDEIDVFKRQCA